MEPLPQALAEAVLGYAPITLEGGISKDRDSVTATRMALADSFILEQINGYIRFKGFSFRPLWHDAIPVG
jgi:hypothetical protein